MPRRTHCQIQPTFAHRRAARKQGRLRWCWFPQACMDGLKVATAVPSPRATVALLYSEACTERKRWRILSHPSAVCAEGKGAGLKFVHWGRDGEGMRGRGLPAPRVVCVPIPSISRPKACFCCCWMGRSGQGRSPCSCCVWWWGVILNLPHPLAFHQNLPFVFLVVGPSAAHAPPNSENPPSAGLSFSRLLCAPPARPAPAGGGALKAARRRYSVSYSPPRTPHSALFGRHTNGSCKL
mmetsp:Transcript_6485/g.19014  ORF Transcript_6485/g.19014 Transcript_6485/m.19014 type:complete len:238 (+) Transcript_6485:1311-2024(+)